MSRERLVVVGGDAAGMSAAHQALRTASRSGYDLEVVAFERTERTSYTPGGTSEPMVTVNLLATGKLRPASAAEGC